MRARILLLAVAFLVGLFVEKSEGWGADIDTLPNSGVKIKVASPLNQLPRIGFLPLRVTIENRTKVAREWDFRSILRVSGSGHTHTRASSETLQVGADSVGVFDILAPLVVVDAAGLYQSVIFELEGYGVRQSHFGFPSGSNSGDRTAYTAMSPNLAVPSMAPVAAEVKVAGREFIGSQLDFDMLSSNWRALVGIGCIWITDAEFVGLKPEQRTAVKEWVMQGGALFVCTQSLAAAIHTEFGLTPASTGENVYGLGRVSFSEWDGRALSVGNTKDAINRVADLREDQMTRSYSDLPAFVNSVGSIRLNTSFLILFIVVFAAVIGPFNLFWLAGGVRRSRLFWTTPAISLAATVVLGALIVVQDGFGATGNRVLLTYLMPGEKKAVVMQEQVTRSGLLFSRSFKADEALFFNPINTRGPIPQNGSRTYDQSGSYFTGDWFSSRAVQAHFAEAIVPTRAEVRVLNSALVSESVPPVLLSSLPVTLREVRYLDGAGRSWHGENLKTGEQLTLRLGKPGALSAADAAGPLLQTAIAKVAGRKEHFWGVADDAPFLRTLASINWKQQSAIYIGPVTLAP